MPSARGQLVLRRLNEQTSDSVDRVVVRRRCDVGQVFHEGSVSSRNAVRERAKSHERHLCTGVTRIGRDDERSGADQEFLKTHTTSPKYPHVTHTADATVTRD